MADKDVSNLKNQKKQSVALNHRTQKTKMTDQNVSLPKVKEEQPDHLGHRKRMNEKLMDKGPKSLTEQEALEMILMRALPRRDTKPLSKQLLHQFVSLRNIVKADIRQLEQFKGIKESAISLLKLIDCVTYLMVTPSLRKGVILSEWSQILDFCRLNLSHIPEEHLYIIYLDDKKKIVMYDNFQRGTKTRLQFSPIEIMQRSLNLVATSIILVHNHPSGEARPSREDLHQTAELEEILAGVGITILDHLIIGDNQIYSINSKGIINEKKFASFASPLPQ